MGCCIGRSHHVSESMFANCATLCVKFENREILSILDQSNLDYSSPPTSKSGVWPNTPQNKPPNGQGVQFHGYPRLLHVVDVQ